MGSVRRIVSRSLPGFRARPRAPLFGALVEDGATRRILGLPGTRGPHRLRRLRAGERYEFTFVAPLNGLCGVGLPVGEARGKPVAQWTLEFSGASGRREVLKWDSAPVAGAAPDWHWHEFDPHVDSCGKRIRVSLRIGGSGAVSVVDVRVPRRYAGVKRGVWLPVDLGCSYRSENWSRELRIERPGASTPQAAGRENGAPVVRSPRDRPLRILTYRWHVAHQYEIYKLPHDFVLAYDLPEPESRLCARWAYDTRPKPSNAVFMPWDEIRLEEFDLLLLHFDENVIDWGNAGKVLSRDWGATFRFLMGQRGLPKVAVCHGTPQFRGMCDASYDGPLFEELPGPKRRLRELMGDTLVICNSYQAQEQWAFPRSRVIWHGFDPQEFPPGRRDKGILGPGPALDARPHYRGKRLHDDVLSRLPSTQRPPASLDVPDPSDLPWPHGNAYAAEKFRNYVEALGAYSVYFNPTLNSPMPRSRGEAMMCGLATVSARNHDVERFIDNERNGFYAEDAAGLADYLAHLARKPEVARAVGERGRERAMEAFHVSRFLDRWRQVFRELTG